MGGAAGCIESEWLFRGRTSESPSPSCFLPRRFYGPALSDRFPDATVWVVPGLLEGKGLPFPFFNTYTKGMRPRCKTLGERLLASAGPAGTCLLAD